MPEHAFDYAIVRVVPRVERAEFINAGVVLYAPTAAFLAGRVHLDHQRLFALWPHTNPELIAPHLEAIPAICEGHPQAGPIAALPLRERFHWLVHPRSAVLQFSAIHSGVSAALPTMLDHIFGQHVVVG